METEISKALAAVRANPPHMPPPWKAAGTTVQTVEFSQDMAYSNAANARHIAAAVNSAPVLAAEVEAIYAKIPATYNGNLDAIFAHAAAYQSLGVKMVYAQYSGDATDLSYEEQLALLIKQRGDAEAEVKKLTADNARYLAHLRGDPCNECECELCSVRDCAYSEPLHHHHDGCPAAYSEGVEECDKATLVAEVERLQGLLAAARLAVEKWRFRECCTCCCDAGNENAQCYADAVENDAARAELRRAVGLEEGK